MNAETEFEKEFVEAVVDYMDRSRCMAEFVLEGTKEEGGEGQHVGERPAVVTTSDHTTTHLSLRCTDLIGPDNVGKWEEALITNTTITVLYMDTGA